MLGDISGIAKIYIVTGHTDMRRRIDRFMSIISYVYELDSYSSLLYLFCGRMCGRMCDRIKALLYEKDGFTLLYKRLESGYTKIIIMQRIIISFY